MKTKVEGLLTNYHDSKRSLELLVFRIGYFKGLSEESVIQELTFASTENERVTSSGASDKTARIALAYRDVTDDHNEELLLELIRQYRTIKSDLDMLDYCIKLLEPKLSGVITDLHINKMTWLAVSEKYFVSMRMVGKYRKKGIAEICKMYDTKSEAS